MKKILLILLVFITAKADAQVFQKPVGYGFEYRRLITDTLFAFPGDTFTVATNLRNYGWAARKGDSLYLWSIYNYRWDLFSGGGGGGGVSSVLGTANRITSSGGANPVINISTSYVGQNSITTLGTITTGVWNGTAIANANLANSTISGISLGSNLNDWTAGYGLLLNSGSTYNGGAARTATVDSATVFPQLRATILSNNDSLFGVSDNFFAANRSVNMNGKSFRWGDGGFANYLEYQIEDNGYLEYSIQNAASTLTAFQSAAPGTWAASSSNTLGTQFFSAITGASYLSGKIGNDWNQGGQWVDFLQEQYNDGTNGGSYWFQHREKWTGSTPFTSSLMQMDSLGVSMRTKKTIGAGHTGYVGLLVDSNSNVRFENYPSSRSDASTTKALYIENANGDIDYGTVTPAESSITFTDITTNNVSTSAHGFFPKLTSNTVYYVNNSGALTALALGANGTVLTSNGATSAPTFTAPAGGGITIGTTTITSGTDKYALYNNAGVVGNYAGFQLANTNLTAKVTTQATTEVGLEIKLASSQTANALNISSSAGTADLGSWTKDGYLTAARVTASSISATQVVYGGTAGLLTGSSQLLFTTSTNAILNVAGSNSNNVISLNNLSGNSGQLFKTGAGYAGYKNIAAQDIGFYNSGAIGNISVLNDYASGNINFAAGASSAAQVIISSAGVVTMTNLAGTGSRTVLADASGVLSAPVSDRSVKKNIRPLDYGLNTIMKLNPVSFEYKDEWERYGQGTQIGFIAQEVNKVLPNSTFITPSTSKMGYNEIDLVPVLVSAMQEQQEQIDNLKKEIKKLKNKK